MSQLVDLWKEKIRLAENHPFSAHEDVFNFALDAIWSAAFPFDTKNSYISAQLKLLRSMKHLDGASAADKNEAVEFPTVPQPPAFKAILELTKSMETATKSPFPVIAHWFLRQKSYMKKAKKAKDDYIGGELAKAERRFTESDNEVRCAMDHIMKRELAAAKKEGRKPIYNTPEIYDEVS